MRIETISLVAVLFPFVAFIALLFWRKVSLLSSSLVTLALFSIAALAYWKMSPSWFGVSYVKGLLVAFDIFIIIFGAIFFLGLLKGGRVIESISRHLEAFSGDYRVQIIILAWFFEGFLEGTAGFGTPVAIVAPLLIGLGLTPLQALAIGLLGNSASVVFGAAGAPIRIGFAGVGDITGVPLDAALLNCVGFIVPVFMLWIATAGRVQRRREFFEALPFAILAGASFVVPSVVAVFLGQEFPSILGSLAGLGIMATLMRFRIGVPPVTRSLHDALPQRPALPAFRAFFPYVLLIVLLIGGKLALGSTGIQIAVGGVMHVFSFFNPGFAFVVAGCVLAFVWKGGVALCRPSLRDALAGSVQPFLVSAAMAIIVQLLGFSAHNASGLGSMIGTASRLLETPLLPLWAPCMGAFGSFVTGSATVANMMFGSLLGAAALSQGFDGALILALGVVGASAGNMIALADMLAAEAVIGVHGQERNILHSVFVPCMMYVFLVGALGLIVAR